jgi:dephospho-CoA kinase
VRPIGQELESRTYRGVGPHPADPRAAGAAGELIALMRSALPRNPAEHVGSTAVPGLEGKNVIDLQITAHRADVPSITEALLGLGLGRQTGPDPWPPERPMLEGTYRHDGALFLVHCHVVPTTDPDVMKMVEFRDLLRRDPAAREAYAADKRRIAATTDDSLEYTCAKAALIDRLLGR